MKTMNSSRFWVFSIFAVILCLQLSGCAAGANSQVDTLNQDGVSAGFFLGLWHGLIAPVAFIISLFSKSVGVYETHNSGGWYNGGFLLGLSIIFGGGGRSSRTARAKK